MCGLIAGGLGFTLFWFGWLFGCVWVLFVCVGYGALCCVLVVYLLVICWLRVVC